MLLLAFYLDDVNIMSCVGIIIGRNWVWMSFYFVEVMKMLGSYWVVVRFLFG